MDDGGDQPIIPGISMSPSGQATVDPTIADVLFDLVILAKLPVGVEHVLAAIVLAARQGELTKTHGCRPTIRRWQQCWPIM